MLTPAKLGFAISSPLLLLREGKRKIQLSLGLDKGIATAEKVVSLLKEGVFDMHFSGEESWFKPKNESVFSLQYTVDPTIDKVEISDFIETKQEPLLVDFSGPGIINIHKEENIGNFIVTHNRRVYKILKFDKDNNPNSTAIFVEHVGELPERPEDPFMFTENDLQIILDIEILLSPEEPPVVANVNSDTLVPQPIPTLVLLPNQEILFSQYDQNEIDVFHKLMEIEFFKVDLRVEVSELKNIVIQNDNEILNVKKNFEPFGAFPEQGSRFYFTHEELSQKKVENLHITTEWLNKPNDFAEYYQNYTDDNGQPIINANTDFKVNIQLHDDLREIPIQKEISLFTEDNTIQVNDLPSLFHKNRPGYTYDLIDIEDVAETEVLEWQRYFSMALTPLDFQHQTYNRLLQKQALSGNITQLNSPYQPKFKTLRLGYTASETIVDTYKGIFKNNALLHIHPFGYSAIEEKESITLLPAYTDNGSLYMGISKLVPGQIVSILFQIAEGSADPESQKPILTFSYLKNNKWNTLPHTALVSDTTNGLMNTGIIQLQTPEDIGLGGTLLSSELHWLKVSVTNHINGISDLVAIKTQVIEAKLINTVVDDSHFETPLQQGSITETLQFIPEIETIAQPFTSNQGKPKEGDAAFNRRVSERLRHKNRALTMWDYEHLILENFPEVYKVKCLPCTKELGKVHITVVPDIRKSVPFNPLSPKVSASSISKIATFLSKHTPASAEFVVKNPTYLKVSTRCSIKFNTGVDQVYFKAKLIEELKEFLSPWAYGKTESISLGGTLDAGVVINFIAERPYVDFVANLKLFQSIDNESFVDVRAVNNGENVVIPDQPDMIIVSDIDHIINIVDDNNYNENSEIGINYMMIERDFKVAKNIEETEK
ncbi:baseplate J/gp47 family protein [Tenacibaculum agarivorans]|uniref:baseplate J/gp47 family protein n=1 Tax=Tenacibaculum agarivorans TaxID=1908389 RepID=UPI00094B8FE6|nr:baseplate J/gp47 family protein [Tenacibaculum agarivorans]